MTRKLYFGLIIAISLALFSGCLDHKDSVGIVTHPDSWTNASSDEFHGAAILSKSLSQESCQSCHGPEYKGGTSGVSCYQSGCHQNYPHLSGYTNAVSENFHGNVIAQDLKWDISSCKNCHGAEYTGGRSGISCYSSGCHQVFPHPMAFVNAASEDFHGNVIKKTLRWNISSCQSCHGTDYAGGSSGVSCYSAGCHAVYPHPANFGQESAAVFHGDFIADNLGWDILSCRSCHGTDYAGNGSREKNCLTCHKQADGPEACNLCHGNSANPAPPADLNGNQAVTDRTVGAHQIHLNGKRWSTFANQCANCHTVPNVYSSSGHIGDSTPFAELNFSNLATFEGQSATAYTRQSASCANVYCHGAFEYSQSESQYPWAYAEPTMRGNNPVMSWTNLSAAQAACGTCHGLPPAGHIAATTCEGCHADVVDKNFNILNKYLHINGKVDVFGTQLNPAE